mmetsp:Transcript_14408/g.21562  ORF Transcript_14408/g.21562 Transcript_14408/m.21562 type:complete len:211 (-) Transcript_14408:1531-2163(-)
MFFKHWRIKLFFCCCFCHVHKRIGSILIQCNILFVFFHCRNDCLCTLFLHKDLWHGNTTCCCWTLGIFSILGSELCKEMKRHLDDLFIIVVLSNSVNGQLNTTKMFHKCFGCRSMVNCQYCCTKCSMCHIRFASVLFPKMCHTVNTRIERKTVNVALIKCTSVPQCLQGALDSHRIGLYTTDCCQKDIDSVIFRKSTCNQLCISCFRLHK